MDFTQESDQPRIRRRCVVAFAVVIAWIAACIAAGSLSIVKSEVAILGAVIGGFATFALVIMSLVQLANAKVIDMLRERGFSVLGSTRSFWHGEIANLPPEINTLYKQAAKIGNIGRAYSAAVRVDGRGETWFIRHIVQHGKTATTRNFMIIRSPENWPLVRIHRKGIVDAVKKLLGTKTVLLESAEFNERISLSSDDADFAILLMGSELQQAAMGLKQADELVIGGGGICLISMAMMNKTQCERMLTIVESVHAAIPPELSEWELNTPVSCN